MFSVLVSHASAVYHKMSDWTLFACRIRWQRWGK